MASPRTRRSVSLIVIWLAAGAPANASDALPVRKAGHWRITTISATTGMVKIDACIGPGDSIAAVQSGLECDPPKVESADEQTIVTVVCKGGGAQETTSTLFTGDFSTWYRGIVKMTRSPAAGAPNLGVTLDARYVGPSCPESPQR